MHRAQISRILCGPGGSGRGGGWFSGNVVGNQRYIKSQAGRRYVARSTASDDPYEKLMLSDLEIHPRAFDVGPRDLCDLGLAVKCALRRESEGEETRRLFKGIYIEPGASLNPPATRETLKSQTTRQLSPHNRKMYRKYRIVSFFRFFLEEKNKP